MGIYYGAIGSLLFLAQIAGFMTLDWDDADFLKIKFGNQRYDITGGLQNPLRFFLQTVGAAVRGVFGVPRQNITGENGKVNELKHDFLSADGFFLRFWRGKLAPLPSLGVDYAFGEDMVGNEFSWDKALASRSLPIFYQEIYGNFKNDGAFGLAETVPSFFGIGSQNYTERAERAVTPAEKLAVKINGMRMDDKVQTDADKELSNRLADIRARLRRGEDITEPVKNLIASGEISRRTGLNLLRGADDTFFESKIRRMPTEYLFALKKIANDAEKASIDEILLLRSSKDALNKNKTRQEREKAVETYNELKPQPQK